MRRRAAAQMSPSRSRWLPGWVRWLVLVLQCLLLAVPVQASGAFHAVTDVVLALAGEKIHQGKPPCSHEEHGKRCPPGCPDCHCSLVVPALLPVVLTVRLVRTLADPIELSFYDATAPPRPVLSGIERPPRTTRFA